MNYIRELATGMGVAWSHMVSNMDMKKEGGHILAYQKGLGLAAEQMKGLYDKSVVTGKKITELGVEMTKYSYALSKQFGMSSKEVSRDVGKAIQDVKHFGQLTVKEINIAATYARKLNVEFEKITATLDSFETFDTSAENAAKLAQSFGANVDAFKMMEAQNPAEQMDMLRKAMFAAGKDSDKMNRQELRLLATTTGLDEATAKQAFAFKNQGVSLDEIKKKANSVENAQMTQAKAMQTLAGAIERMVKSGDLEKMTSFFDAFVKGVLAGLRASKPFMKLMMEIRFALRATWFEGFKLGRELIKIVPGMQSFFETLHDIFNPSKMRHSAQKVREIFEDFFKSMTTGKFSFEKLMDNLKKHFFDYFTKESPSGQKILNSLKKMLIKMGEIAGEAITYFSKHITEGIKMLADFVRNPAAAIRAAAGGGTNAVATITKMFDPMLSAIKAAWPAFKDAVWDLMKAAWGQIKVFLNSETFSDMVHIVGPALVSTLFGPAIMRLLMVSAVDLFTKVLFKGVEKAFEKGALEQLTKFAGTKLGSAIGIGAGVGAVIAVGIGVSEGMRNFRKTLSTEFTEAQRDISSGVTGLIDMLTFGLTPEWMLPIIAEFGAKLLKSIQDMMNHVTGGLGTSFMTMIQGSILVFAGIGDVIMGILSGDFERIIGGLGKIVSGALKGFIGQMVTFFVNLPITLIKYIQTTALKIWSGVFTSIGELLKKLGFETLGTIFLQVGEVFKKMSVVVGKVYDVISKFITLIMTAVASVFGSGEEGGQFGKIIQWIADKLIMFGSIWLTVQSWVNPVALAFRGIIKIFEKFGITWESVGVKFDEVYKYILKPGFMAVSAAINTIIEGLDNALNAMDAWQATVDGKLNKTAKSGLGRAAAKSFAKKTAETTSDELNKAAKEEADKVDFMGSIMSGKSFDVSKAPTKAVNYATEAVEKVEEIKKKLENLAPEKLNPVIAKVGDLFKPADQGGVFMKFIQDVNEKVSGPDVLKAARSLSGVANVFESLTAIGGGKIEGVGQAIDNLTKFFSPAIMTAKIEGLNAAITWAGMLGMTMEVFSESLKNSGIIPALHSVQEMVNTANELDQALSQGNDANMNIKAKLRNVANAVGLGGKMNYEIKNRGVNIQVNLEVHINAADMEKAMIMRGKSIIRDRLNNADYPKESASRNTVTALPTAPTEGEAPETYYATGHLA
jgi:hypothetical protein